MTGDDPKTARMRKAFEADHCRRTQQKRLLSWDELFTGDGRVTPEHCKNLYFSQSDEIAWRAFRDGVRYGELNPPGAPVIEHVRSADDTEGGEL